MEKKRNAFMTFSVGWGVCEGQWVTALFCFSLLGCGMGCGVWWVVAVGWITKNTFHLFLFWLALVFVFFGPA